jgi:N-acetylmuramoyl-L-alanine amidase
MWQARGLEGREHRVQTGDDFLVISGSSQWLHRRGMAPTARFLVPLTCKQAGHILAAALVLMVALTSALPQSAAAKTVRDIKLLPHDDGVRVVIDLGSKVPFQHRTFDHPPRLVVELPDVSWQIPERRGRRAYRMVKGFQFGRLKNGVSNLIIDVDRPFEIETVFELPPSETSGYRIVTDLAPLPPNVAMRGQRVRSKAYEAPPARAEAPRHDAKKPPWRRAGQAAERRNEQARPSVSTERRRAAVVQRERPPWQRDRSTSNGRRDDRTAPVPTPRPSALPSKRMVVIDPGHGGIDPGASGKRGTYEKNVVLATALELRRQLVNSGRYDVILTRDDDSFVRLRDRLQIARASAGHLFLSLHADSLANNKDVRGAAVYTLSDQASSEEAERLASTENRADILGGIDLSHHEPLVTQILIDLAQRDANGKSLKIADFLVEELGGVTKLLRKQRQQAGFVVLKSPDMPSALIELGYLSNVEDERRLTNRDHLTDLSKAIVKAIDRYFEAPPS